VIDADFRRTLELEATRLGFDRVGIAPAVEPDDHVHLLAWLNRGDHAGMTYMKDRAEARAHPRSILENVRSVVMASLVYGRGRPASSDPRRGRIARYAQGADYHGVLRSKLESLLAWVRERIPEAGGRAVVDTAPLLERDFARRAGLGWIGKNTMLIDRRLGSYTFLGALLVDVDLPADSPHASAHCGTCTRCLDACPTDAFHGPYQLDARRCISYWTIEHKGDLPDAVADRLEDWVFGCDVCQDVCPWNRKAPPARDPSMTPNPERVAPDLIAWIESDPKTFARGLVGTALERTKRRGLIRNALAILTARRVVEALPAVERLLDDPEPVVRAAAARAFELLGRVASASNADDLAARDASRSS
jgi:epoxyqueuosine reductase